MPVQNEEPLSEENVEKTDYRQSLSGDDFIKELTLDDEQRTQSPNKNKGTTNQSLQTSITPNGAIHVHTVNTINSMSNSPVNVELRKKNLDHTLIERANKKENQIKKWHHSNFNKLFNLKDLVL